MSRDRNKPPMGGLSPDDVKRAEKLAEWHSDQAKYPVDVSGSDSTRYRRKRFHEESANVIGAMLQLLHNA